MTLKSYLGVADGLDLALGLVGQSDGVVPGGGAWLVEAVLSDLVQLLLAVALVLVAQLARLEVRDGNLVDLVSIDHFLARLRHVSILSG